MSNKITKYYSRIVIGSVALLVAVTAFVCGVLLMIPNNSEAASNPPETPVIVETPFIAIANSDYHSLALNSDGTVWSWGTNTRGQVGDGTRTQRTLPLQIPQSNFNNRDIQAIAATSHHSVALDTTGVIWAWGLGYYYCDGSSLPPVSQYTKPYQISKSNFGGKSVTAIAVGDHYTLALDSSGDVWAWGSNKNGQLGRGTTSTYSGVITKISGLKNIVAIAAGSNGVINVNGHNLALDADGNVWTWGQNKNGQIGNATTTDKTAPYKIPGTAFSNKKIVSISASSNHSMALDEDGNVWAWGANTKGQLGSGTTTQRTVPTRISPDSFDNVKIVEIAAGDTHSIARDADGNIWAWGANSQGQLGDGTTTASTTPQIMYMDFDGYDVTAISASGSTNMAVTSDGSVWAWGENSNAQIGDGTKTRRPYSTLVLTLLEENKLPPTPPPPVYKISLSTTGTHQFSALEVGYTTPPSALALEIKNTGNQQLGNITVTISGPNADSFELIILSPLENLPPNATAQFTVQPKNDLAPGLHTATVTVSGDFIETEHFNVTFFVELYEISVNPTEHAFPTANAGYSTPIERVITVINTGNMPTGALNISASGNSPYSFVLTANTIPNIAVGGTTTFTVRPVIGLPPGVHTATIRISGNKVAPKTVDVSFTVVSSGISLTPGEHVFDAVNVGYTIPPSAVTATITNIGDIPTGNMTVSLTGPNPNAFVLSERTISSIQNTGGIKTFTVRPTEGLSSGTYIARVSVSGSNITTANFDVVFLVGFTGIVLSQKEMYSFRPTVTGYTSVTPLPVKVTNIGNQETGPLTVSLSGTNAGSFRLSRTALQSIPTRENTEFTVTPIAGLSGGTYTATVSVSGENVISQTFNITFAVGAYGISMDQQFHRFIARAGDYPLPAGLIVPITNIGSLTINVLNITLSDNTAFTVSTNRITVFAPRETAIFIINPKAGLAPGPYYTTVTVSSDLTPSYSFLVALEVHKYSCSCCLETYSADYTPLYFVLCATALALLLWLGLRKIPKPEGTKPPINQKNHKKDKGYDSPLLLESVATWTAQHYQPQSQPKRN